MLLNQLPPGDTASGDTTSGDTTFNIVSFGSRHSSLWPSPVRYSPNNLAEAVRHVEGMKADMGGTDIYHPLQERVLQSIIF